MFYNSGSPPRQRLMPDNLTHQGPSTTQHVVNHSDTDNVDFYQSINTKESDNLIDDVQQGMDNILMRQESDEENILEIEAPMQIDNDRILRHRPALCKLANFSTPYCFEQSKGIKGHRLPFCQTLLHPNYGHSGSITLARCCKHCFAIRLRNEQENSCCAKGKVVLPHMQLPPILNCLYDNSPLSKQYIKDIRMYNSAFSMVSMGGKIERGGGGRGKFYLNSIKY